MQWTVKPPLYVPLWQKVVLLLWAGSFGQMRPHETPEVPHSLCNERKDAISSAAGTNSFNFVLFSLWQQVIEDGSVCLCLAVFTVEPLPDIFSLYNVRITVCVLLSGKCWLSRSSLRWAKEACFSFYLSWMRLTVQSVTRTYKATTSAFKYNFSSFCVWPTSWKVGEQQHRTHLVT